VLATFCPRFAFLVLPFGVVLGHVLQPGEELARLELVLLALRVLLRLFGFGCSLFLDDSRLKAIFHGHTSLALLLLAADLLVLKMLLDLSLTGRTFPTALLLRKLRLLSQFLVVD